MKSKQEPVKQAREQKSVESEQARESEEAEHPGQGYIETLEERMERMAQESDGGLFESDSVMETTEDIFPDSMFGGTLEDAFGSSTLEDAFGSSTLEDSFGNVF